MNQSSNAQKVAVPTTKNAAAKSSARFNKLLLSTGLVWLLAICLARAGAITNAWSGGGGDDNWSTSANWNGGAPGFTSTVFFTADDPAVDQFTSNNIVASSITIDSLFYRNTNVTQTTHIPLGSTLAITGQVAWTYALVNVTNSFFCGPYPDQSATATGAILGEGTLLITNPFARVSIRNANGASPAILNLSNLNTFIATVDRLTVGAEGNNAPANRPTGILRLARTNFITSFSAVGSGATAALTIGEAAVNSGGQSIVTLGYTNVLLADSGITVGGARNIGRLEFGADPGVAYFRNRAGTGRQGQWGIGDNNTGSTGTGCTGVADFSGGIVDAMVGTIYVGRGENAANVGLATGTLIISNGVVDVNDLRIGFIRGLNFGPAIGTVTISGGSITNLVVNNAILLANINGTTTASGTLNIGSTVVAKQIIGGGGNATVNLNAGGSLRIGGKLGNEGGVNDRPVSTLALNDGVLTLDLGSAGNPITSACNVSNLTVGAVTVNVTGAGLTPGTIALIKAYTSVGGNGFAGITQGTLPPKTFGYFSNSTDTLYFVVTGVDTPKWKGNVNGNWDIATTTNWLTGVNLSPTIYQQASVPGDAVLFDDTATGTTTVNLTTVLSPLAVNVNNSLKTYTFGGAGGISGPGSLSKNGSGTLVLANTGTNDFTGAVAIGGGKLQLSGSANLLPTNAIVTLANAAGAVLDLNGQNQRLQALAGGGASGGDVTLGAGTLTLVGNGSGFAGIISGTGGIIKTNSGTQILSGANTYGGGTFIYAGTLAVANETGSGISSGSLLIAGGTLQIGGGGTAGSIAQGVITNNGTLAINRSDDLTLTNLIIGTGNLQKSAVNIVSIPQSNSFTGSTTITDGALRISHANALGGVGTINVGANNTARLELSNNITLGQPLSLSNKGGAAGQPPNVQNLGGTNTLSGTVALTATSTDWVFQSDDGLLIVSGSFTNTSGNNASRSLNLRGVALGEWRSNIREGGGATSTSLSKRDAGTWVMTGTNTYIGATVLNANGGTLVVNGAILNSSGVAVGINATLAGSGLITCGVTNGALSFLAPGNSIGTLTISNWLNLSASATSVFEVGNNTSDQVRGLSGVIFGGTLQVSVVGNLYGVESFKLFDAQSYNGNFGTLDLPTLPSPLAWDTTALETQGILRVTGGINIATNGLVGGHMTLSGTGPANNGYRVLASTNVALPFNLWTEIGSSNFSGSGSFTFTDTNTSNFVRRFYRMVTP